MNDAVTANASGRRDIDLLLSATRARMTTRISEAQQADGSVRRWDDERALGHQVIEEVLSGWRRAAYEDGREPLDRGAERALARRAHDLLFGLGGLQPYLDDPAVLDVHCFGHDNVFVHYADGRKLRVPPVAGSDEELEELVRIEARRAGRSERRWDKEVVALDFQLPDGSRLHALREVTGRPVVDIRRHNFGDFHRLAQMAAGDVVDRAIHDFLAALVQCRFNLLVAGTRGIGKTTLLRCLCNEIPQEERIITIEDSLELGLDRFPDLHPDVVSIEARPPNTEGQGAFDLADGVYEALRIQGRIVVGETRGPEVIPMLKAISSGDEGSMSTIHAMSSANVFNRLKMYARMVPDPFPTDVIAEMVAESIQFVVHMGWDRDGRRRVQSIREVVGSDGNRIVSNEVWAPDEVGRAVPHARLTATTERVLEAAGYDLALRDKPDGWWRR